MDEKGTIGLMKNFSCMDLGDQALRSRDSALGVLQVILGIPLGPAQLLPLMKALDEFNSLG